MRQPNVYVDLDGHEFCLEHLTADELKLLARLRRRARINPDWDAFDNYWTRAVSAFYESRGLPRTEVRDTLLWRVAQDLSSRLGIAAGLVRPDDYQGDLEDLISERFASQRAFCKATGLSEDMLSHVLAGRKDLSLARLTQALARISYRLRIEPMPECARPGQRKQTG